MNYSYYEVNYVKNNLLYQPTGCCGFFFQYIFHYRCSCYCNRSKWYCIISKNMIRSIQRCRFKKVKCPLSRKFFFCPFHLFVSWYVIDITNDYTKCNHKCYKCYAYTSESWLLKILFHVTLLLPLIFAHAYHVICFYSMALLGFWDIGNWRNRNHATLFNAQIGGEWQTI